MKMQQLHRPHQRFAAKIWVIAFVSLVVFLQPSIAAPPNSTDFFEQRIRPVLVEHCYECHAADTDQQGGLMLDTKSGWQVGGDSGPAIIPGNAASSRLMRVIAYQDAELEMPPDNKLPDNIIEDFRTWIDAGAIDPREEHPAGTAKKIDHAVDWDRARKHWAYQSLNQTSPPQTPISSTHQRSDWPRSPIDQFILHSLESYNLAPSKVADSYALIRRLSIDLTGLPPDPQLIQRYTSATDESIAYEQIVDQMLASHDFAERFARHWLDVARYAESVTLRGLVQPEAWRYRDYVIEAIHQDRSWKDIFREQIAGDLIHNESIEAAQRAHAAVTFLCMGNMNLENQQKRGLEMDFIDEQLDTIGRAMLGQTIGCARCHDHKFDPIPTFDYYAMAGILHGSIGIDHSNVSRWVEVPLPLTADEETHWTDIEKELTEVTAELTALKKQAVHTLRPKSTTFVSSKLPGIVVDDSDASRIGDWQESHHSKPYIDAGYLHDLNSQQGEKSITFEPSNLPPGRYNVRVSYCGAENRTTKAEFTVFSADGETTVTVNQRQPAPIDGLWESLGEFRFEPAGQAFVMLSNSGADGHVIADAVQFLPVQSDSDAINANSQQPDKTTQGTNAPDSTQERKSKRLEASLKQLASRQAALQKQLNLRPKAMGLRRRPDAIDLPIHIRGSIHNLGERVPRGTLNIISDQLSPLQIAGDSCGRIELADWIANDQNPLTTRVLVNRIWLWVMGQGIVRTPDNFGTTGQPPTHPELLDWLTIQFIQDDWSIKRLVKQIVMSSTYRQSARLRSNDAPELQIDPDNRLWWRSDRKPVSAEAIRDSVLAISGELDPKDYGSRIRGNISADYGYEHDDLIRSIYMPVFRNAIPELLETFNYTDTSFVTGQRQRGIVAQQALAVLNHPWFQQRSLAAADRNLQRDISSFIPNAANDVEARIEYAFLQTLSRHPDQDELTSAKQYVSEFYQPTASPSTEATAFDDKAMRHALAQLYQALFATAEFRQLD
jgi:hypothetical protein